MEWFVDLHDNLLTGQTGRKVNALGGALLAILCLTGRRHLVARARAPGGRASISIRVRLEGVNFDLHSALGFWSLLISLMWGVTGIYFAIPNHSRRGGLLRAATIDQGGTRAATNSSPGSCACISAATAAWASDDLRDHRPASGRHVRHRRDHVVEPRAAPVGRRDRPARSGSSFPRTPQRSRWSDDVGSAHSRLDTVAERARAASAACHAVLFILYIVAFLDRVNVGYAALQMAGDLGFSAESSASAPASSSSVRDSRDSGSVIVERWSARKWIARIMISWGILAIRWRSCDGPQFYTVRFLLGARGGRLLPGHHRLPVALVPVRGRAKAVAMFMAAIPVSNLIGSPISDCCWGAVARSARMAMAVHRRRDTGRDPGYRDDLLPDRLAARGAVAPRRREAWIIRALETRSGNARPSTRSRCGRRCDIATCCCWSARTSSRPSASTD
jgi:hypothetical protein